MKNKHNDVKVLMVRHQPVFTRAVYRLNNVRKKKKQAHRDGD